MADMFTAEAVLALLQKQKEEFEALLRERDAKKHELGRTNPLLLPPYMYDKEVLQMNQPFLFFATKRLPDDKSRVKMDEEVLRHAISKALVADMLKCYRLYKDAKELPLMPLHLSLLSGFFELTRPSTAAQQEHKRFAEMFTRKTCEEDARDEEYEAEFFSCTTSKQDEDSCDDAVLCLGSEDEFDLGEEDVEEASSNDSINLEHQMQRTDIAIKVYDRALEKWVTVCVVQGKEPLNPQALYQALCYACRKGLLNVEGGCVAPIYFMAWSASMWSYGMLDIYGAISINKRKIEMSEFQADQERRWKALKKSGDFKPNARFTFEELSSRLERARRHLPGNASYKDGKYLVASVYISNETYALPNAWDVHSPAALLFYEMLLRIIIGDRVVKWTTKDVDEAYSLRENMHKSRSELLTASKRRKLSN